MSESKSLEINWLGVTGSALGSVSAAVVLSTLGAAGTLIGAALGSLLITVGGTFYAHTLQRAKSGIVKAAGKVAPSSRQAQTTTGTSPNDDVTPATVAADTTNGSGSTPQPPKSSWRQTLRSLPWKRIAWLTAGLFAITMVVILAFELSTGRPVSSYTGGTSSSDTGTTFSGWTNRNSDDQQPAPGEQEDQEQAPEQQAPEQVPEQQQDPQDEEQQPGIPDSDEQPAPEEQAPSPPSQEQAPQPEQQAPQPEQEAPPQ